MIDVNVEFERECYSCLGRSAWSNDEKCNTCNSTGKVPTGLGEALLEFLERNGIRPATAGEEK